jgi:hypothetical protein
LAECDRCLSFGNRFAAVIRELINELGAADPLDPAAAERLHKRLRDSVLEA